MANQGRQQKYDLEERAYDASRAAPLQEAAELTNIFGAIIRKTES
jgi:hypothetical protein